MEAGNNKSPGSARRRLERRRRVRGRGDGWAGVARSGLVESVGFESVLVFRIGRVVIRRRMAVDDDVDVGESGSLRSRRWGQGKSMSQRLMSRRRSQRWPCKGRRRGNAAVNRLGWPGAAVYCLDRENSTRPASDSYERSASSKRALLGLATKEMAK